MIAQIDKTTKRARYYDVRRLTPREVYRLMGVDDDDIDQLLTTRLRGEWQDGDELLLFGADEWNDLLASETEVPVIPMSEHYKLAGNSIVVNVLAAIFRQIFRPAVMNGDGRSWNYRHPGTRPISIITLCAGYDSQCLALTKLCHQVADDPTEQPLSYKLVAWSEFDPESTRPLKRQPAVLAHDLLFPDAEDKNLGDMTKIDWSKVVPSKVRRGQLDVLTYSTPCTDISKAGKQAGLAKDSGTRSSILWHTEQAIQALQPRFLLQENVAELVGRKARPYFNEWLQTIERLGYRNYWAVLNAKKFGVPQNRDRVFCVSVRNDICPDAVFSWPSPSDLRRVVFDIIEPECDRRYFLEPEQVIAFLRRREHPDRPQCYHICTRKLTPQEIHDLVLSHP